MTTTTDTLGPPRTQVGILGWLRKNLFSTWYNALLTLLCAWVISSASGPMLRWALRDAQWGVITTNLRLFMVGQYPPDQAWRVWLALVIVSLFLGLSAGTWGGTVRNLVGGLGGAFVIFILL